ncbi:MAG: hypothetical protein PHD48_03395 [Alphaproteobacteria bacterium]|nr:hypothetical protein [Alphaproteobacteria bacterium]
MTMWAIAFIVSTVVAAAGFVVVAIVWLKKLRDTLAVALGETAGQQIRTAQRLSESLAQLQRQQTLYDQRMQSITEANLYLQTQLQNLANKVETNDQRREVPLSSRVIH